MTETALVQSTAAADQLTPGQIVRALDKYIIGQDSAKRSVAIALRNRWRRQQVTTDMRDEIVPNNIIMIGPTGVGKTEIARRLAKLANAPFIKVEATKYTEVGYVGRDVESMIRDLAELAVNLVRAEKTEEVREKAQQAAEARILDILIPPIKRRTPGVGFSDEENVVEENAATRERFREQLEKGELDDRMIELDVAVEHNPSMQVFGPAGLEEMGINLQDMFGNMFPKKNKKRKVKISEAKNILAEEEAEKLIDMDAVVKEAVRRVENSGIVFIDEIDKVAAPVSARGGSGPDVSRQGVQRDLLPIVEGSTISTKYGLVKTDHILFIASGAFHVAKPSDLIPELQGRFPIRVELSSLTEEDFYKILTVPRNALIKQYQAMLSSEGVELEFTEDAIRAIARTAAHVNREVVNIGARRLHTILTTLLEDVLFDTPEVMTEDKIEVDEAMVTERLQSIAENQDLSKYIL